MYSSVFEAFEGDEGAAQGDPDAWELEEQTEGRKE